MNIYGRWSNYEQMRDDWFDRWYVENPVIPDSFPKEEEVLFASYGGESYEGDAFMLWSRDGKFYESHGSHCSCYGLEGQFEPEETSLAILANKGNKKEYSYYYFLSDHDSPAYEKYWELIDSLLEKEK